MHELIAHYLATGHTVYCEEESHQINICAILELFAHFAWINRLTTQTDSTKYIMNLEQGSLIDSLIFLLFSLTWRNITLTMKDNELPNLINPTSDCHAQL